MPITISEFAEHLGNVTFPLAVAVSGGADSLALLLLAHELAAKSGSYVIALTVDHQLRSESKTEALQVKQWANKWGIEHVILNWDHDRPTSGLQEKARKARYALLTDWCRQQQISTLLLGHHQQDQEETFWLRLSSGSGLDGLAGMKRSLVRNDVVLLRPLLDFSKERIKNTLRAKNQEWIEDPSNKNPLFFRGRLRHFLQEEGLSSPRLLEIMKKLQNDADFIYTSLYQSLESITNLQEGGYITLHKKAFNDLHPTIAQRVVSFLLQWFSDLDYAPRTAQVSRIFEKIKEESSFTSGGIYWTFSPEQIFLFRENRAVQGPLILSHLQERTLWDQRFWVDPALKEHCSHDMALKPLGTAHGLPKEVKSLIPRRGWPVLPALWEKGMVVAVPHLCYNSLKFEKDLRNFFSIKPLFHDSLRITI